MSQTVKVVIVNAVMNQNIILKIEGKDNKDLKERVKYFMNLGHVNLTVSLIVLQSYSRINNLLTSEAESASSNECIVQSSENIVMAPGEYSHGTKGQNILITCGDIIVGT